MKISFFSTFSTPKFADHKHDSIRYYIYSQSVYAKVNEAMNWDSSRLLNIDFSVVLWSTPKDRTFYHTRWYKKCKNKKPPFKLLLFSHSHERLATYFYQYIEILVYFTFHDVIWPLQYLVIWSCDNDKSWITQFDVIFRPCF